MSAEPQGRWSEEDPTGPPWWIGLAVGGAVFAFGLAGLLHNATQTKPANMATWVLGSLAVNDALLLPAVLVAGALLTRLVPAALRGGLQATLAVAAAVALMSIPVVLAEGRAADNPSLLPHDYGKNLAIVIAVIVVGGTLLTVARAARRRRAPSA